MKFIVAFYLFALGFLSAGAAEVGIPPRAARDLVVLPCVADTWVDGDVDNGRQDVNFGGDDFMHIYSLDGETVQAGATSDMLLKFDVGAIPAHAIVTNAMLRLYWLNNGQGANTNFGTTVYICGARQPWTEFGATLNKYDDTHVWDGGSINASPNNYDEAYSSYRFRTGAEYWANTYVTFDVTALVAAWSSGTRTNQGIVVVNNRYIPNPDLENTIIQNPSEYNVASREDLAHSPEISVEYIPFDAIPPTGAILVVK